MRTNGSPDAERIAAFAVALLSALAVLALTAVPATAQSRQAQLTASGALTVTWRGAPARGCASGAPCDVLGSTVVPLDARGSLFVPGGRASSFFADLFDQRPAVVRVRRRGTDPAGPVCVDTAGSAGFGGPGLDIGSARTRGQVRVTLRPRLDAGRCAGPLPADVAPALPSTTVDADSLRRGNRTIALRGTRRFAAGPFTGTVASSVVLRVGTPRGQRRFEGRPPAARRVGRTRRVRRVQLIDTVRVTYDVETRGELASSFRGLAAPECDLLDACGLSGRTSLTAVGGGRRTVTFLARATRRRGADRPSVARLLRPIRAGDRRPSGGFGRIGSARVHSTARREGIAYGCAEQIDGGTLGTQLRRERGERGVTLELIAYGSGRAAGTASLRTRCPGPAIPFGAELAAGRVPLAELGTRALTVRLAAQGGEAAPGYAVTTRAGEIVLRLSRRSASVSTNRRVRSR